MEHAIDWSATNNYPAHDYLRFGNDNAICYAVTTGRISAWILYNCDSGIEFLGRINQEQVNMIWPIIDSDVWQRKFRDYAADAEYARNILREAGW
jgi:hypothetical protein